MNRQSPSGRYAWNRGRIVVVVDADVLERILQLQAGQEESQSDLIADTSRMSDTS